MSEGHHSSGRERPGTPLLDLQRFVMRMHRSNNQNGTFKALISWVIALALQVIARTPAGNQCTELYRADNDDFPAAAWLGRFCDRQVSPRGYFDLCWRYKIRWTLPELGLTGTSTWRAAQENGLDLSRVRGNPFVPGGVTFRRAPGPEYPGVAEGHYHLCPEMYACVQKLDHDLDAHIICAFDSINQPNAPQHLPSYLLVRPGQEPVGAELDEINRRYTDPPGQVGRKTYAISHWPDPGDTSGW